MSYKNQGNNLKGYPVLQAGSSFEISPYGFDSGSRTFVIDQSKIPLILPTRGTADTSISYISQSGVATRGGYAQMYVDKVGRLSTGWMATSKPLIVNRSELWLLLVPCVRCTGLGLLTSPR